MSKPFGAFSSPIDGASIASGVNLRDVQWNSTGDTLVWWESRGRQVCSRRKRATRRRANLRTGDST